MLLAHVGFRRHLEVPARGDPKTIWIIGAVTEDFSLDMLFPFPSWTRRVVVETDMKG